MYAFVEDNPSPQAELRADGINLQIISLKTLALISIAIIDILRGISEEDR